MHRRREDRQGEATVIEIRPPRQRAYQVQYYKDHLTDEKVAQYRSYSAKWRAAHPEYHAQRRADMRNFVDNLKRNPCMDCGGSFPPECMDFNHRDPSTKIGGVAKLSSAGGSMAVLLAEIAKCDLVCANCHRIRTWRTA
jgi:hypothetical protein